jgi:predicted O-methyltransferase YrrM
LSTGKAMSDQRTPPETPDPLHTVLRRAFGRTPSEIEMRNFQALIDRGVSARQFVERLAASRPFAQPFIETRVPPGHYYSPIVDPDTVRDYVARERLARPADLAGIDLPIAAMEGFWRANADLIAATPFTDHAVPERRYHYRGGPYAYGDAIVLRAMMAHFAPRRIVEVGSGFSSACMLDCAEELALEPFSLTCVEPYPDSLRSLLRPEDWSRVTLHERPVQGMPLEVFEELEAGDILFLDSSHVMKTGSDVHYLFFHVLPVLRPGVLVHFHDCRYPLEYSDILIFETKHSWNEAYALRALLSHSMRYRVFFWGSLFAEECRGLAAEVSPTFLRNPGSALWLRVL